VRFWLGPESVKLKSWAKSPACDRTHTAHASDIPMRRRRREGIRRRFAVAACDRSPPRMTTTPFRRARSPCAALPGSQSKGVRDRTRAAGWRASIYRDVQGPVESDDPSTEQCPMPWRLRGGRPGRRTCGAFGLDGAATHSTQATYSTKCQSQ
jgi:hypothetical protein